MLLTARGLWRSGTIRRGECEMRARYTDAIEWIASNDEPTYISASNIESLVSVQLIADLFGKSASLVASDVRLVRLGMATVRLTRAMQARRKERTP